MVARRRTMVTLILTMRHMTGMVIMTRSALAEMRMWLATTCRYSPQVLPWQCAWSLSKLCLMPNTRWWWWWKGRHTVLEDWFFHVGNDNVNDQDYDYILIHHGNYVLSECCTPRKPLTLRQIAQYHQYSPVLMKTQIDRQHVHVYTITVQWLFSSMP